LAKRSPTYWAGGTGQNFKSDALTNQAIKKLRKFNFALKCAVMAQMLFSAFPDCVEIAKKELKYCRVVQPGVR